MLRYAHIIVWQPRHYFGTAIAQGDSSAKRLWLLRLLGQGDDAFAILDHSKAAASPKLHFSNLVRSLDSCKCKSQFAKFNQDPDTAINAIKILSEKECNGAGLIATFT